MPSKGKERSEEGDESEKALRAPLSSHVSTHSVSSVAQGGTSPSFLTSYYCFAMLLGGSTSVSRGLRVERGERKCGAKWTI